MGIYKIENLVNGKVYIGQAVDVDKRLNEHKRSLSGNYHINKHLQNSWNKYEEENFKFEIVEECEENKLTEREQYWIDYYGGINNTMNYNLREADMKGHLSEETKRKMSCYWKGRVISEDTRRKMRENHANVSGKNNPMYGTLGGMYGKKHTEEWKQAASIRYSGKNNPMYGKPVNVERREKIRKANMGIRNGRAKSVNQYDLRNNFIKYWDYAKQASDILNINLSGIIACCRGRAKTSGGYIWKYANKE